MKMIKTIIFDLGKVLVNFDMNKIWNGFARYTKIPVSEMEKIVYETSDGDVLNYGTSKKDSMPLRLDTGRTCPKEFYEWMHKKLELKNIGFKEFSRIWGDIFTANKPVCGLAQKLYDNGYGLVALSDTDPIQKRYIMLTIPNTMKLFNKRVVTSYEIGSTKPNKKNYLAAIAKANAHIKHEIKPEECAYIEDRKKYIIPAVELGINGVWYDFDNDKNAERLKEDLRNLGVRC